MTEVNLPGFVRRLRLTTAILASDAAEQLEYLHGLELFDLIDELALQFDDSFVVVPAMRADNLVSEEAEVSLRAVDAALSEMSDGPPHVWSEAALTSSPQWSKVRELARAALEFLPVVADLPVTRPNDDLGGIIR